MKQLFQQPFRWLARIVPVSVTIGLLVALFLWLLDIATTTRWHHMWLIFLLPLAGICITWLYFIAEKNADAGTSLIIDEIHVPGGGVPARMTPLIFITTIITHLFGGSAGREGTAVQMGGSMAALFSRWYKLEHADRRILLLCGMSAGFGAVFGTPVAGAVFALEVVTTGKTRYDALIPCLIAGFIADLTCRSCGIHHTRYAIGLIEISKLLFLKVILAGIVFGVAGMCFTRLSHFLKAKAQEWIHNKWLIPVAGAALIVGGSYLLGSFDYLGLGVTNPDPKSTSIMSAFRTGGADTFSWLWKLIFTAITLGFGYKGGEVTPLFFIGATLGNTLAVLTGAPIDLFAGLGFIAVFAAATRTPLASTLLGIELFGTDHVVYYAIVCSMAYYSGRRAFK